MAFEDLIVGADSADEPLSLVSPELVADRAERKGMATDMSARARDPLDFGADDEVIGPAPMPKARKAKAVDFGADDEVIGTEPVKNPPLPTARPAEADAITGPVPLPKPRPAPTIQPTAEMPPVQPLEDTGRFRSPGMSEAGGSQENMLTGEEAFAEREANIKGAVDGVAEARARLDAAKARSAEISDGSTRALRRGTTGDLMRQAIKAEVDNATENLAQAERALAEAERAAPPTMTKRRDAAMRLASAVGQQVPDVIGGFARPVDAALDLAGIKDGTGTAEKMREFSKNISKANPADVTRDDEFSAKLGQGAGSAVGFVVTGAIGKAAGAGAAVTSALTGGAQNAEQYYREADDMGASGMKKALAYIAGGAIGATEGVGLGRMADVIEGVDKATGGGVRRYFGLVLKEAGEEGLQEGVQQLLDNITKYGLYGKDPGDITKDVGSNALVGALLGMGMAGIAGSPALLTRGRAVDAGVPVPEQPQITPEEIVRQILGQPSTPPATAAPEAPVAPAPAPASNPGQAAAPTDENSPAPISVAPPAAATSKSDVPSEVKAAGDETTAILRGYGYDDAQIADMSPSQRETEAAAAREAGTQPAFGADDEVVGAADLQAAAANVDTSPSEAQKDAGNYAKGHVLWNGLDITIENPKGSERSGKGADGKPWSVTMPGHYGYIRRTVGKDGDQVDVTFGDDPQSNRAFVVDQYNPTTGKFDEHKLFVGYPDLESATRAYDLSFSDGTGPKRRKAVSELSVDQLKDWLRNGDTKKAYSKDVSRSGSNADVQALAQREGSLPQSQEPILPQLRGPGDQATPRVGGELPGVSGGSGTAAEPAAHSGPEGQRQGLRAGQRGLGDKAGAGAEHAQDVSANVPGQDAVGAGVGAGDRSTSENGAAKGGSRSQRGRSAVTKLASDGSSKPLSLLQFIASKGGLAPHPELAAIGITGSKRVQIPGRKGFFGVVRPTGNNLDTMREMAEEAGYFRGEHNQTSTLRDLLDAMDTEERGQRKMPEGHEAEPIDRETDRAADENANRDATLAQHRAEIEEMLAAYGMPNSLNREEDIRLAAEIMADEGLGADEALERAAMRNLETDIPVTPDEITATFDDFGVFDAVQPGPTQADERPAADESAGRERPREEERPAAASSDVPDTRQDREGSGESAAAEEAAGGARPGEEVSDEVKTPSRAQATIDRGRATADRINARETEREKERFAELASKEMETALDKIEEAVEAGDREAVLKAGRDARKVLADTTKSVKDAEPEYWKQFKSVISKMLKPGYVTAKQEHDKAIADAPTWAEVLHKLPMIDGSNRDTDLAFNLMASLTGGAVNKQKFDNLTAEQRHELLKLVSDPFHNPAIKKQPAERTLQVVPPPRPLSERPKIDRLLVDEGYKLDEDGLDFRAYTHSEDADTEQVRRVANLAKSQGFTESVGLRSFKNPETGERIDIEPGGEETSGHYLFIGSDQTQPAAEKGPDGKDQLVLPGAEKESQGKQAQRKADAKLKPKAPQKAADIGLFGDEKDQTDLLDAKPAEPKIDADVKAAFDDIFGEEKPKAEKKAKQPQPKRTREKIDWTEIGKNAKGQTIYEDQRGVRSYVELGVRITEAVGIIPGGGISLPADRGEYTVTEPLRGKAELAKSAATKAAAGTKSSIKALGELFGGNKLSSGLTFDDETYAKAKPIFLQAASEFKGAFKDVAELARLLVDELRQSGYGMDVLRNMRPYLEKFVQDVKDGTVSLTEVGNERSRTGNDGAEALDAVPPQPGEGIEGGRDAERGAAGSGEPRAGGDRTAQEPGLPGDGSPGSGAAEVHPAATGARGRRAGARVGRDGSRVPEGSASAEGRGRDGVAPSEAPTLPAVNYRITDETELGQGSETVKFRDNIAAIETVKTIEREQRRATAAEQRTLARFVGWGGLANAFRDTEGKFKPDWQERGEQLEVMLTKDELAAARRSTRNAHYTSRTVVDAMWEAATRLGFKGGLALELSSGTGNFIGLVPEAIAGNTRFVAVEYDSLTARIAKALYPQDTVLHTGLHKLPLPEGEAVLNIGNPPFGSESLRFQYSPELNGLSIHNQFFLAGLDALRPGGLQILVVSRYLMDAQDQAARKMLAKKAKLLGAIRLPDTAFKENARTEVVTDIIFLQRHTAAEEADVAAEFEKSTKKGAAFELPSWIETTPIKVAGGEDVHVNQYFASNRNMVVGTFDRTGSMYGPDQVNVTLPKGADLASLLKKAIDRLPSNVLDLHQDVMDATLARHKTMGESLAIALSGHEVGHVERTDGKLVQISERETPTGGFEPTKREITPDSPWSRDLYMDSSGQWYTLEPKTDEKGAKVKSGARNVYERKYFENNEVPSSRRLGKAKYDKLSSLVDLRDLTKRQLTLEAEDAPTAEMEGNRKKLASAYQSYVNANGYLNEAGNLRLLNDLPDGALVMALEMGYRAPITAAKAARTGEQAKPASAKPAPIMSRRVVPKYEPATKAESPSDALFITLSEVGYPDMDRISQLLGIPREQAIEQMTAGENPLLYKDPETGGFDTANGYLSGNVVRKLKAAEAAGMKQNADALRKVQPERWTAENISAKIGANWIPPNVYAAFAKHMLGVDARVHYSQATNSFNLFADDYAKEKADQWGTSDMPADAILRGILNSRVPKVMREDSEGHRYVDQEATALVSLKAKEMENEFADWVFADGTRRNQLTDIFNEKFNTRVNRQHDGTHLMLPGKVPDEVIKLRRHQKNAVWRGISERFTLFDHVVGAGKTFTAIARVMERRRMGLSRKPMIVVPNHLVDQWTADVYRLYPGAKVLAAGKNQFEKKGRRRLFAKIATGDWDVVIVPHSSFGFIGIAPETENRFLEEELRLALEAVEEAKDQAAADGISGGRSKPFTVKEAERLVTTIEGRMDKLKKAGRDNMLTFEQMGVDDLTVDEAHEFKNLFYSSRLTGVRGMGDKSGSQKAFDLYNKTRVLRDSPTGTITFMTGTPISNSAVEMYTMMRYLAAKELAELGIEHFDAWRSQYVSATAKFEPTEAGGLKEVTRLGRDWSNMRALMELYYSFTDAVSQEDINKWYAEDNQGARFPVPKVRHGGRKEVVVKPTEAQSGMLQAIVAGFNALPGISDPIERNATRLRLMDRARKVSLDVRAADPTIDSDEKGGKLDRIADNVAEIHKRTKADAGTQLVFIDRSVPSAKGDKKVIKEYDDLIAKRDEVLAAGDETKYRTVVEALDKFDANEIETLRSAQAGGWNAYDQLKSNLIARGIPADEIRFVQEANNDAEKKALFDAVNDGTVRVLVGSTPRMGAGTNVQERLVALHHGDVTWKPSDIEQREGRIIRQGNKLLDKHGSDNFEVDILAYVTERTVDAKMWDLNATKLKMINGIRKYDGAFNMEFEDEDSVGMAEIAALASGDPLLLERVKLMAEIDKLELLERAHRRKMFGVEDAIHDLERAESQYPAMIEAGKAKAAEIQSAIDTMRKDAAGRSVTVEGKPFTSRLAANDAVEKAIEAAKAGDDNARYTINVNGQRVTNKETAEAILNAEIGDPLYIEATIGGEVLRSRSAIGKALATKATDMLQKGGQEFEPIGKMLGYHLALGVYKNEHRLSLTLTDGARTIVDAEQPFAKDTKGFVPQTIRALLDKLEMEIEYESEFTGKRLQARIDEAKTRLPSLRAERGKPFAKAEELKGFRDRLEEVIKTLDARTKAAEGKGGTAAPEEMEASIAKIGPATDAPIVTPEKRAAVEAALTDVVSKIAGTSVTVKFVDKINLEGGAPPAWGSYGDGTVTAAGGYIRAQSLIYVAMADPAYPLKQTLETTFHEAFHHLENRLLTDQEMEVLKREDGRLREIVKRAFGFSDAEIKQVAGHEIRAMAFEYFANRRARGLEPQGLHIGIRRAFERLMDLFRRVRNALSGLGFQNADDIFATAADGGFASRTPRAAGRGFDANIRQVQPQGNLNRFESYEPLPEDWREWWKRPDLNWRDRLWGMIDAAFLTSNRALGDRYVDMRRMQAAVELAGRRVNEGVNMALAAVLFEGKTEKRLKDYWLKTWKPVLDFARSQGITRDELHRYLYARHAPERNAHIAEINPAMPEGGSGMTDAEAQEIMDGFASAGKREALERVAQRIDGIVRQIREGMVADQLEHEETVAKWEQTYPHYVPLKGFESGDEDMAQELSAPRPGRGFDVRGPETKAALGRQSKADDILSNLFLQGERAIIRGEQNRVGRTAMRFMQSNPQPQLYDVSRSERVLSDRREETITEDDIDLLLGERPITIRRINRETGLVETVTRVTSAFAQNSFAVKVGGHTYYITIKHPGLLTALKNVGVQRLPWLVQAHGWLTRQFAAFRTARNPDFFVSNLFRDVQDAAYTLGAEQRQSLVRSFATNILTLRTYAAAFIGELMEKDSRLGAVARRKFADSPKARLFEDWKKHGGQIAFMGISDMDEARKEIEAAFNEGSEGIAKRALFAGPRAAKALLKAIEFFNAVIEGGTRLAVYDAGMKAGMTAAKAAELSKESTTNFNRKGIYSPYLNSFYAFFNARVQGATKIIRLLRTSKIARRAAIGLVMGGFATTLWNLAASPDDEDKKPEYMRRKYWERERYFIMYWPGSKEPFRMPMGYGLQLFWMLGENMAMLSQGKITPAQAAANYLSTIVGAFSPLQAEGSPADPGTWLRTVMPSIWMPTLELTTNEDWRRKPIHPKFEQKGLPHSEQYFTTTSPHAIEVAQFLNRVTGGTAFKRGTLDLYPGDLQYVWNFAVGGLGQTVNRTTQALENWKEGVPTPPNQVPILRHFVGANVEQSVGESYYEDRDAMQKGMAAYRKAGKASASNDDAAAMMEEGATKYGAGAGKRKGTVTSEAEQIFRKADKELKELREQERAARNDKTMPKAAREQLIKDIRENMRQVQEEARRFYKGLKNREATF